MIAKALSGASARRFFLAVTLAAMASAVHADVERRTLYNGQLVLEDIPEIPEEVVNDLRRFQNVRSAFFRSWTQDGNGLFVTTPLC